MFALTKSNRWSFWDSSPFKVAGKDTVTAGYKQGFCYRCKITPTGMTTSVYKDLDNLSIKAYADCSVSLSPIASVTIAAISFKAGGT